MDLAVGWIWGAEGKGGVKRVSALYNWVVASIMVNNSGWKPGLGETIKGT